VGSCLPAFFLFYLLPGRCLGQSCLLCFHHKAAKCSFRPASEFHENLERPGMRLFFSSRIKRELPYYTRMEPPTLSYVASGFLGMLVGRIIRLDQIFRRSRSLAPPNGHDRAAIRERHWYRKTNEERIATEKALTSS
jgi:hypothetical protein